MNPYDNRHSISNYEERGHDRKLSREYYDYIATQYATYPIHHIEELCNALSDYYTCAILGRLPVITNHHRKRYTILIGPTWTYYLYPF